jgi:hypothetical protein
MERCATIRRALGACERAVAGRCPESSRACDKKRAQLRECESQPQLTPVDTSGAVGSSTSDRNGRRYIWMSNGECTIDDSGASHGLAPMSNLPRLKGPPSCGQSHCVAVDRALGVALTWATSGGAARFGQLGWPAAQKESSEATPPYEARRVAMPPQAAPVTSAAAGDNHTALVDGAGGLWLCGSDRWTQLGQEQFWSKGHIWSRQPRRVRALEQQGAHVRSAALGADHTLALDSEGRVWAFGRGEHGQLFGASRRPFTAAPQPSAPLSCAGSGGAREVWADGNCSCALAQRAGLAWTCIGHCKAAASESAATADPPASKVP